jgi:hypothetical protein
MGLLDQLLTDIGRDLKEYRIHLLPEGNLTGPECFICHAANEQDAIDKAMWEYANGEILNVESDEE